VDIEYILIEERRGSRGEVDRGEGMEKIADVRSMVAY